MPQKGKMQVVEDVFENSFMHLQELVKMGADIDINGNTALIKGVKVNRWQLWLQILEHHDLFGWPCYEGQTIVDRIYHVGRGMII